VFPKGLGWNGIAFVGSSPPLRDGPADIPGQTSQPLDPRLIEKSRAMRFFRNIYNGMFHKRFIDEIPDKTSNEEQ
jgi:hypothetical protein